MSGNLQGKIAVITGGSSGIGLAAAKLLSKEGAAVTIVGRRESELQAAAKEIGGDVSIFAADVTKPDDLKRLAQELTDSGKHVDIVFANAGVLHIGRLESITEADYYRVFDTSVKGALFTVQALSPLLSNGASVILNAAAIAGKGITGLALNAAAKSGVRSLARTLAAEFAERSIRVNALSPGSVVTPILEAAQIDMQEANEITKGGAPIALQRPGTVEEIANAVLFLASDASSYITGIDLPVDGGQAQL